MELETKAVEHGHNHNSLEIKQAFEEFLAGFEAFKDANDARLKGLEKRGDVLDGEKVARIDAALTEQKQKLDTLMLEARRPQLAGERRAFDPVRIDGLPLVGGGFKAEIAGLQQQLAARDLADAKARADALAARQKWIAAGEAEARAHLAASAATSRQIETIVEKVPVYVGEKSNAACVVPWGAVRLLDAAASGAGLDAVSTAIAPGQPDDAASDVTLSEAVALLATDLGIARDNADQLIRLEAAVRKN